VILLFIFSILCKRRILFFHINKQKRIYIYSYQLHTIEGPQIPNKLFYIDIIVSSCDLWTNQFVYFAHKYLVVRLNKRISGGMIALFTANTRKHSITKHIWGLKEEKLHSFISVIEYTRRQLFNFYTFCVCMEKRYPFNFFFSLLRFWNEMKWMCQCFLFFWKKKQQQSISLFDIWHDCNVKSIGHKKGS
jgi:hypothetical protein